MLLGADNPESSAILAEIYVWQYIIDHEAACQKVVGIDLFTLIT